MNRPSAAESRSACARDRLERLDELVARSESDLGVLRERRSTIASSSRGMSGARGDGGGTSAR